MMPTTSEDAAVLRIGRWRVDPSLDEISSEGRTIRLEPLAMRLLLCLARHAGRPVELQQLLDEVWTGVIVAQGSVYQAIAHLRRTLGDDTEHPTYIDTVPRKGYRLIAPVSPWVTSGIEPAAGAREDGSAERPLPSTEPGSRVPVQRRTSRLDRAIGAVLAVGLAWYLVDRIWILRHSQPAQPTASVASDRTLAANADAATPATFAPPPHSLAVLPFVNMSGDTSQEYFSDGLTEEILNSLASISELQVSARTSAFSFKGKDVKIGTVARELNVGSILEGSVRRSGHKIRVTAQLDNAVTGFHLWSQSYDRDLSDVLQLQTDIANAVANALKVTLLGDIAARIEVGGTRNPAAFDAYLRATKIYRVSANGQDAQAAIAAYTEAIRLDPDYALAYADRSIALNNFAGIYTRGPKVDNYSNKAWADAKKSVALAPDLGEGHLAMASFLAGSLDFPRASQEYQRALSLAPGNARLLYNYGTFAVNMGQTEAGLAAVHRAVALDPLSSDTRYWLGSSLLLVRRYGEAIEAYRAAKALDPNAPWVTGWMGVAYYLRNDFQSARGTCEGTNGVADLICLAITYDKLGRRADAEAMLAKLRAARGDDAALAYAWIYAQWGNTVRALEWLETAMRRRDTWLVYLKTFALGDPLRQEPRFQAVEKALKFPD